MHLFQRLTAAPAETGLVLFGRAEALQRIPGGRWVPALYGADQALFQTSQDTGAALALAQPGRLKHWLLNLVGLAPGAIQVRQESTLAVITSQDRFRQSVEENLGRMRAARTKAQAERKDAGSDEPKAEAPDSIAHMEAAYDRGDYQTLQLLCYSLYWLMEGASTADRDLFSADLRMSAGLFEFFDRYCTTCWHLIQPPSPEEIITRLNNAVIYVGPTYPKAAEQSLTVLSGVLRKKLIEPMLCEYAARLAKFLAGAGYASNAAIENPEAEIQKVLEVAITSGKQTPEKLRRALIDADILFDEPPAIQARREFALTVRRGRMEKMLKQADANMTKFDAEERVRNVLSANLYDYLQANTAGIDLRLRRFFDIGQHMVLLEAIVDMFRECPESFFIKVTDAPFTVEGDIDLQGLLLDRLKSTGIQPAPVTRAPAAGMRRILEQLGEVYEVPLGENKNSVAVLLKLAEVKRFLGVADLKEVFVVAGVRQEYQVNQAGFIVDVDLHQQKALLAAIVNVGAIHELSLHSLGFYNLRGSRKLYEVLNAQNFYQCTDIWWVRTGERHNPDYGASNTRAAEKKYAEAGIVTLGDIGEIRDSYFVRRDVDNGRWDNIRPTHLSGGGCVAFGGRDGTP